MGVVAIGKIITGHRTRTAGAFGHVLAGHLEMDAAGDACLRRDAPRRTPAPRSGCGRTGASCSRSSRRWCCHASGSHDHTTRAALLLAPRAPARADGRATLSRADAARSASCRPGSFVGVERVDQVAASRPAVSDGPHFRPSGFLMPRQILDMGMVGLARAVADPDHVARGGVPVTRGRIDAGQRLLIAEQQRLVAGVEIGLAQRVVGLRGDAARPP